MAADEALADLVGLKALCRGTCGDADTAVLAIPADARAKAAIAHHMNTHGDEALAMAFAAGRGVTRDHLMAVNAAVKGVADGQDVNTATGADPEHVALIAKAGDLHEGHREKLEAAYAKFAAASAAEAQGVPPSNEPVGIVQAGDGNGR